MEEPWFPYHQQPLQKLERHLLTVTDRVLRWVPPGARNSIWWILEHLISTEDFWVHGLVYHKTIVTANQLEQATTVQTILDQYKFVRTATDRRLIECTEQDMARVIQVPVFDDGWTPGVTPTVHWVFHHVFEHEMYHLGQISQLLRMQGQAPLPF